MKLSKAQMRVLNNVGEGLKAHHHCRTNSDWGGLSGTLISLRKRGLLADDGGLTDAGREAIEGLTRCKYD
jgi:hypothetical protein